VVNHRRSLPSVPVCQCAGHTGGGLKGVPQRKHRRSVAGALANTSHRMSAARLRRSVNRGLWRYRKGQFLSSSPSATGMEVGYGLMRIEQPWHRDLPMKGGARKPDYGCGPQRRSSCSARKTLL
jgi:hypothetical protein